MTDAALFDRLLGTQLPDLMTEAAALRGASAVLPAGY